jgi:hypothetical protein
MSGLAPMRPQVIDGALHPPHPERDVLLVVQLAESAVPDSARVLRPAVLAIAVLPVSAPGNPLSGE